MHKSLLGSYKEWAYALKPGVLIQDISKPGASTVMFSSGYNSTGNGRFSTYFVGYWVGKQNRYLGLRFIINGKVHYGWARLSVQTEAGKPIKVTLAGYAYETVAKKAIRAGKTKGPDDDLENDNPNASLTNPAPDTSQPPTLGVLALGAPGLSVWRRKESMPG